MSAQHVERAIEALRQAMDRSEVPTDYRVPLIGYFCTAWNASAANTDSRDALRSANAALAEALRGFLAEFGDKAVNANVRKARAALKDHEAL